jgi:hypothetical protein
MLSNARPKLLHALLPAACQAHQQLAGLALAATSTNNGGSDLWQITPHTQNGRVSALRLLNRCFKTSSGSAQDRLVAAFIQVGTAVTAAAAAAAAAAGNPTPQTTMSLSSHSVLNAHFAC